MLRIYYAATLLFVILDYFMNINVRLAFLEAWPEMRALYYLLCFVCLGLMIWRPNPPQFACIRRSSTQAGAN